MIVFRKQHFGRKFIFVFLVYNGRVKYVYE